MKASDETNGIIRWRLVALIHCFIVPTIASIPEPSHSRRHFLHHTPSPVFSLLRSSFLFLFHCSMRVSTRLRSLHKRSIKFIKIQYVIIHSIVYVGSRNKIKHYTLNCRMIGLDRPNGLSMDSAALFAEISRKESTNIANNG